MVRWDFTSANDLILDNYYSYSRLRPSSNHTGYIGYSLNFFRYGYFTYLYYYSSLSKYSDIKLKKNIKNIKNPLEKVTLLNGYKYDLSDFPGAVSSHTGDTAQYGLIAQEVLDIIPEVVHLDTVNDLYTIDYVSLIPFLVEAIKEQNKEIEKLKDKVKKTDVNTSETISQSVLKSTGENTTEPDLSISEKTWLGSNAPNPFTDRTTISYNISSYSTNAYISVYDLQGKLIKTYGIENTGKGDIIINGSELYPGLFKYALIVDGTIIDIKTLILTE